MKITETTTDQDRAAGRRSFILEGTCTRMTITMVWEEFEGWPATDRWIPLEATGNRVLLEELQLLQAALIEQRLGRSLAPKA